VTGAAQLLRSREGSIDEARSALQKMQLPIVSHNQDIGNCVQSRADAPVEPNHSTSKDTRPASRGLLFSSERFTIRLMAP